MTGVVHPDEIAGQRDNGADVRVTFDEHLTQRVVRIPPGRWQPGERGVAQEILYVVSGNGSLVLDGDQHELTPGTGAYVAPGEAYEVDADDELVLVSVIAPRDRATASGKRKVTVRFDEQPELPASPERSFRYLVNQDAGCFDVTQFVGIVRPSRAPPHSHTYDEVGYIVEGEGFAHIEGESVPLRPGSCFHLAPGQLHCIENSGSTTMRILGVFHPSGDPSKHEVATSAPDRSSNPPESRQGGD